MKIAIIPLLLILSLLLFPVGTRAESRAGDYSLFIPDSTEQYNNGMKVMVAGMEHNLTFNKFSENITVIMYSNGYFSEGFKNESTYYRWRYLDGNFYDLEYGKYINTSSSALFADKISFHIGIYSRAEGAGYHENGAQWHFIVKSGDETVIEDDIFVENATAGLGLSTPEFEFRVEPFSGGSVGPSVKDYRFRTMNTGNVPLFLTGSYDNMGELFETTNMSIILKPGDEVYHSIFLRALPWSPQIFSVTEHIRAVPLHIMSTENVNFISSPVGQVHISVKVVRNGFNILEVGGANLQYEQGPQVAEYNEIRTFRCFLNGNGSVKLTLTPSRLLIKGVYYGGKWHNDTDGSSPVNIDFSLKDGIEEEVRISVKFYKENTNARLSYRIENGGKTGSAYTDIVVGKAPAVIKEEDGSGLRINTVSVVIAVIFIALIAGFVIYHGIRERKNRERENDKNDTGYRTKNMSKKRKKK